MNVFRISPLPHFLLSFLFRFLFFFFFQVVTTLVFSPMIAEIVRMERGNLVYLMYIISLTMFMAKYIFGNMYLFHKKSWIGIEFFD